MVYLRSSPASMAFLILSSLEVYHASSREIWSYFLTSSVNASTSWSSMCWMSAYMYVEHNKIKGYVMDEYLENKACSYNYYT